MHYFRQIVFNDAYTVLISPQPYIIFLVDIDILEVIGTDGQGFGIRPERTGYPFFLFIVNQESVSAGSEIQFVVLFQNGTDGIINQLFNGNRFQIVRFGFVYEET